MQSFWNKRIDDNEHQFFLVLGNLDLLKHIVSYQGGEKWYSITSGDWASKNGYLNLLVLKKDLEYTANAMDWAAFYGHLDVIKWLHENRKEGCTTDAMDFAAGNGHLEVVKWLHENRKEGCTGDAMDLASENGHLEIVKWLHENRTEECTTEYVMD